jgi:cobaltochelatase CobT
VLDGHARTLAQAWARLRLPVRRLARDLARGVQRPEPQGWAFDLDAGRLDGRQLARLVTRPGERHVFKEPLQAPHADAAITLLIDCSGSMRQHALASALFASALGRMAALAQLPFEVLGFGTSSWNGGQARAQWQRQRRPAQPGRVADRLHLVVQSARMRPLAARRAIAALLQPELYREGLDGEAVAWAGERLAHGGARRRILFVLSDGCPSETATAQLNDPDYLARHLRETVARQARMGTEVIGIGLGLDLRAFYPRNLPVEPEALLHTRTFAALWRLLAAGSPRT